MPRSTVNLRCLSRYNSLGISRNKATVSESDLVVSKIDVLDFAGGSTSLIAPFVAFVIFALSFDPGPLHFDHSVRVRKLWLDAATF